MGIIRQPQQVKLFSGIIADSIESLAAALTIMQEKFGSIDIKSLEICFDFTDYYANEMGKELIRSWVGFKKLISPLDLAAIKVSANAIEDKLSVSSKRRVNIDPGYITAAKIVLASSKDFSHRVYMSEGIYGEVTLIYKHKEFVPLEWTYPDYKSKTAMEFFHKARKTFQEQIKE